MRTVLSTDPVCYTSIRGFLTHLGEMAIQERLLCHCSVLQSLHKRNKSLQPFSQCYLKVKNSNSHSEDCLSKSVVCLKAFMHSLHLELPEELQVLVIYESVRVNSEGLVKPQQSQVSAVPHTFRSSEENSLNNTGNKINISYFIQKSNCRTCLLSTTWKTLANSRRLNV